MPRPRHARPQSSSREQHPPCRRVDARRHCRVAEGGGGGRGDGESVRRNLLLDARLRGVRGRPQRGGRGGAGGRLLEVRASSSPLPPLLLPTPPSRAAITLHLRNSSLSAATRSHSCLRSTPSEAKACGCEASGAMAIAVITCGRCRGRVADVSRTCRGHASMAIVTESPKSVGACREMTRGASFARLAGSAAAPPSPSPPPLSPSAAAVGAKRGNSASICQPVPPSLFGGWQASTRTYRKCRPRGLAPRRGGLRGEGQAAAPAGGLGRARLQRESSWRWTRPARPGSRRRRAGTSPPAGASSRRTYRDGSERAPRRLALHRRRALSRRAYTVSNGCPCAPPP